MHKHGGEFLLYVASKLQALNQRKLWRTSRAVSPQTPYWVIPPWPMRKPIDSQEFMERQRDWLATTNQSDLLDRAKLFVGWPWA
jgi:hypothetical protein